MCRLTYCCSFANPAEKPHQIHFQQLLFGTSVQPEPAGSPVMNNPSFKTSRISSSPNQNNSCLQETNIKVKLKTTLYMHRHKVKAIVYIQN